MKKWIKSSVIKLIAWDKEINTGKIDEGKIDEEKIDDDIWKETSFISILFLFLRWGFALYIIGFLFLWWLGGNSGGGIDETIMRALRLFLD